MYLLYTGIIISNKNDEEKSLKYTSSFLQQDVTSVSGIDVTQLTFYVNID